MPGNEFEAQFKRSGGESPPQTTPRNVIDGKEAIAKYIDGSKAPMEMTGAELHACVAHLKTTYGGAADGLEADLMKIRRQQDKKIKLVEWVQEKEGRTLFSDTAPAPLTKHRGRARRKPGWCSRWAGRWQCPVRATVSSCAAPARSVKWR